MFEDRRFTIPRNWSNHELKKFSYLFKGDVINVSGWKDKDKQGKKYSSYFENANSYTISNFETDKRGFQGKEDEIFLDLTKDLPEGLNNRYDVVFNHTVLEHIFEFKKAFSNLCGLSKDIVIIVVPFIQEMHGEYGDYWRFTPQAIKKLFKEKNMNVIYSSFNKHKGASVYLFFIASKKPHLWKNKISNKYSHKYRKNFLFLKSKRYVGASSINNTFLTKAFYFVKKVVKFLTKRSFS